MNEPNLPGQSMNSLTEIVTMLLQVGVFVFTFALGLLLLTICYLLIFKTEKSEGLLKLLKRFNVKASTGGPEMLVETHAPTPSHPSEKALSAIPPANLETDKEAQDNSKSLSLETSDMYRIAYTGSEEELEECFHTLQKNETDPVELEHKEATFLNLSYERFGRENSLQTLWKKFSEKPLSIYTTELVDSLSFKERNAEIISTISPLAEKLAESRYSYSLTYLIEAYYREESLEKASSVARRLFPLVKRKYTQIAILHKLGAMYGESDTKQHLQVSAAAYELSLQLNEDDDNSRFQAAYKQSEANLPLLSYSNYQKVGKNSEQHTWAINNLGVIFDKLGLKGLSNRHYRKAADKGYSLSKANLAHSLIEAGLYDEAQELLSVAIKDESCHKNVTSASDQLNSKLNEENEKIKKLNDEAPRAKAAYRKFCAALLLSQKSPNISGDWLFEDKVLTFKKSAGTKDSWISDKPKGDEHFQMTLTFTNNSFSYEVKRNSNPLSLGGISSLLADTTEGIGYYNDESECIELLHFTKKGDFKSQSLRKVCDADQLNSNTGVKALEDS